MAEEGQSDKMVSDIKVYMKQRCVMEFLYGEKIEPTDILQSLLNTYGDQTEDVSTVRQCILHFSCGKSESGSSLLMQIFTSIGMQAFFHHWQKCIANKSDYAEKQCLVAGNFLC